MRYLQDRNQFLIKKIELRQENMSSYYHDSKLLRETMENDITWGGSLLGRLINSAIRKGRIGFNSLQVNTQLKHLRAQLDYLVSASISGETKAKLETLQLKSHLEKIKDLSLQPSSSEDDEKKILKDLLGLPATGNIEDWYDPENPKVQKTSGYLQAALDALINNFPDLKEVLGIDRDVIIDTISDFSDELRVYAYELKHGEETAGGRRTSGASSMVFRRNFGNVIDAIREIERERQESSSRSNW